MKYWKGINSKSGQFGVLDDFGSVPDSIVATKSEYDAYVASFPPKPTKDFKDMYSKAVSSDAKISVLAEMNGLI